MKGSDRTTERLATQCVVNLIRTDSALVPQLERIFRRHGLTGPGFNVLMILDGAGEPLAPSQIGERRLVTRGTITALLDTLERQGYVSRHRHPDDGRMQLIALTTAGRAALRAASRELMPAQAEMLSCLTLVEKQTLVELLEKLQAHLAT